MTERLKALASFINKSDIVADIGCDHAYLAIYLKKFKLCEDIIAVDINNSALNNAINNIKKENLNIKTYLSDGLENVPKSNLNTLIISGMGATSILHIMDTIQKENIKKIIIQSNNDLYFLRKNLLKKGFILKNEKIIYEKDHFYVIGKFLKEKGKLKKEELYFGIYNKDNLDYYKYLEEKLSNVLKNIPLKHIKKRITLYYELKLLKKYL